MDVGEDGVVWGKYLRIRVALDIHKPPRRVMKLVLGDHDILFISSMKSSLIFVIFMAS